MLRQKREKILFGGNILLYLVEVLLNFFLEITGLEIAVLILMVLVPTIYSWAFSRKKDKEKME